MMRTIKQAAAFLLAALLVFTGGMLLPATSRTAALSSGSLQVSPDNPVLYGLEEWAKEYLTLPAEYPQSVQLQVSGVSSYQCRVIQGDSVEVTSSGRITPKYITMYWNNGIGTSWPTGQEGEVAVVTPQFGSSVVRVQSGSDYVDVTVTFADYADRYADQVMDNYLAENVTEDMSGLEKVEKICQFVAGYDYSVEHYTTTGMIVSGGGDCWSSTYTILAMCEKLGIRAWVRNANKDPGAGSGHRNAMVEIDGAYYEAEAGFEGSAPRPYYITPRSSLFSYTTVSGGIELYQYDGYDGLTDVLEIPAEIDGRTVVGLGENFLSGNNWITQVILPDTLTYLEPGAFFNCQALTTLRIPAGVTSIGYSVVARDTQLVNFTCDPANPNYAVADGVLYDKAMTTVLAVPAAAQVTLPETVTSIGEYAFSWNDNLTAVSLPDSVTALEEGAFWQCSNLTRLRLSENLTQIGYAALNSCYQLDQLILPESVVSLGGYALENFRGTLYLWPGSEAERYALQNSLDYVAFPLPGGEYDQNRDGRLDALDLMALAQGLVDGTADLHIDFAQDGTLDVLDVMALAQMAAA